MSKTEIEHEIRAREAWVRSVVRSELERQINSDKFKKFIRDHGPGGAVDPNAPPFKFKD